jgi:hypothetical protein
MAKISGVILTRIINITSSREARVNHGQKKAGHTGPAGIIRVNISFGVNEGNNEINDDSGIYCIPRW